MQHSEAEYAVTQHSEAEYMETEADTGANWVHRLTSAQRGDTLREHTA